CAAAAPIGNGTPCPVISLCVEVATGNTPESWTPFSARKCTVTFSYLFPGGHEWTDAFHTSYLAKLVERWILQSVTVLRECLGAHVSDRIGVFFNRSESVFGVAGTSSSVSDQPAACA